MRPERIQRHIQSCQDSIEDIDKKLESETDSDVVKQLYNAKREVKATLKDLQER